MTTSKQWQPTIVSRQRRSTNGKQLVQALLTLHSRTWKLLVLPPLAVIHRHRRLLHHPTSLTSVIKHKVEFPRMHQTFCEFLNESLGPNREHLELHVPVEEFLQQHNLRIHQTPGNGHCLIQSWAMSTQQPLEQIKNQILQEFNTNRVIYKQAGKDL